MNIHFHVVDEQLGYKRVTVMLGDIIIASMILRPSEVYELDSVLRRAADRLMRTGD